MLLIKNTDFPYLVFVHGGPGFHSGVLEYLIEREGIFDTLNFNLILYDQRNCGRSPRCFDDVQHSDNVNDLQKLCQLFENQGEEIRGIVGHSYGAIVVNDYMCNYMSYCKAILIATSSSILKTRINNLLLDFCYLKATNNAVYDEILNDLDELSVEKLVKITNKIDSIFIKNNFRRYFYWANMAWEEKTNLIQKILGMPMNAKVFQSVRNDLYKNSQTERDSIQYESRLFVNGFHDYIMDGSRSWLKPEPRNILFMKSGHYPHIEEQVRFCEVVNDFLKED